MRSIRWSVRIELVESPCTLIGRWFRFVSVNPVSGIMTQQPVCSYLHLFSSIRQEQCCYHEGCGDLQGNVTRLDGGCTPIHEIGHQAPIPISSYGHGPRAQPLPNVHNWICLTLDARNPHCELLHSEWCPAFASEVSACSFQQPCI